MKNAKLEHINLTVADPLGTAALLVELFDWKIRWQGDSIYGGLTVHVGGSESYLALYSLGASTKKAGDTYSQISGLNHIGVVVGDLKKVERRVTAAGFKPHSHADYEPGQRFYFADNDGLEFEVISYQA